MSSTKQNVSSSHRHYLFLQWYSWSIVHSLTVYLLYTKTSSM